MKYTLLKYILAVVIIMIAYLHPNKVWAQIKIGDNSRSLNPNALLELESKNKGLLLPRLSLQSTNSPDPLKDFETGMMVYNISSKNDVTPGIYFSDGSKWIKAVSPNSIPDSTAISTLPFLSGAKTVVQIVSTSGQSIFQTPLSITDSNKIFLYRNGVLISFTVNNISSIISEVPCNKGDQIRIIQLL